MARSEQRALSVAEELGSRAHAVACDVTDDASCAAAVAAIQRLGGGTELLALVNNAGFAADLPWFPTPWPATAAKQTLAVNLFGAARLTRALLPLLLASADGRVVFVSSGGGRLNMKRMSEEKRQTLLATDRIGWPDLVSMAEVFTSEYEAAAAAQADGPTLPLMSPSGWWLQSYGFSKACLGAYSQILRREEPSLLSATCSPGWVATEMSSTYSGDATMRSIDEGGEVPAWLACGDRASIDEVGGGESGFFMPDRSCVGWVAE